MGQRGAPAFINKDAGQEGGLVFIFVHYNLKQTINRNSIKNLNRRGEESYERKKQRRDCKIMFCPMNILCCRRRFAWRREEF
jgi:hypothetical protein